MSKAERAGIKTLAEAKAYLQGLEGQDEIQVLGKWSATETFQHCAQSIEMSMQGYPKAKPWIVRHWIGPALAKKFQKRGYLGHGIENPIPGAPALDKEAQVQASLKRLLDAIGTFESHEGEFKEHFAFGKLQKEEYSKIHALHINDHFPKLK